MPKINNSTFLGSSLQIPYYKVISDSEDVTVSPRIFFNDKFLLQSEYRQAFKKSNLILDHSIKLDNENSVTHLFGNFFTKIITINLKQTLKLFLIVTILKNMIFIPTWWIITSILNSYIDFEESMKIQF